MKIYVLTLILLTSCSPMAMSSESEPEKPSPKSTTFFNSEHAAVLSLIDASNAIKRAELKAKTATAAPKPARAIPLEATAPVITQANRFCLQVDFHADSKSLFEELSNTADQSPYMAVKRGFFARAEREISEGLRDTKEQELLTGLIQKERAALGAGGPVTLPLRCSGESSTRPMKHFGSLLKRIHLSDETMNATGELPASFMGTEIKLRTAEQVAVAKAEEAAIEAKLEKAIAEAAPKKSRF